MQYFRPALSYNASFVIKIFVLSILSGRLKQVLLYQDFLIQNMLHMKFDVNWLSNFWEKMCLQSD